MTIRFDSPAVIKPQFRNVEAAAQPNTIQAAQPMLLRFQLSNYRQTPQKLNNNNAQKMNYVYFVPFYRSVISMDLFDIKPDPFFVIHPHIHSFLRTVL